MRRLLFALPVLIALGVLLATWRGGERIAPRPAPADAVKPRYQVTDGRWVRFNAQGQSEFEATAEVIEYYDDESARLRSIEMHSLGGARSPWRISAPEGYAPAHSGQRLQLRGGVRATGHWPEGGEPMSFDTPYLWIDERRKEIYTDAPVHLRGRSRSAEADGLHADWIGRTVQLLGQVRMQYAPPQ